VRSRPFTLTRPALFRERELQAIEQTALRLLEETGIEISHLGLEARARSRGFEFREGRVRLPRKQVAAFLEETRQGKPRRRRATVSPPSGPVRLGLSGSCYPQSVYDPETEQVVPFTSARLIEAAKLVAGLRARGVSPVIPGYPVDVPAALQPLLQYRIAVEHLPGATGPVDPKHRESLPYVMEMAEAMGQPIRHLPVYVFSPLRLAGESLTAVMEHESQLEGTHISAMPAAGCTAPARPAEGFALAAAEVIGAALILRRCLSLEVGWSISLFPFDLRGMAMSFGSPESLLFQAASSEVEAYFRGDQWWPGIGNIHTLAKEPGPQAAAEKMSVMMAGALWGARHFAGAGALSLDEVFSPVQLLVDVEIKDHVERLVNGLDTGLEAAACVRDVREGIAQGFVGLERTLDRYRELYWHPRLFERRFLAPWQAAASPLLVQPAREMIRELTAQHDHQPPADALTALDRIYRRAERELAGGR
jgi:trimethylamine:corrinoid methyltransferase-like protein